MCPLEGKELEGPIGDVGSYSVDIDDKGKVTVEVKIEKAVGVGKVAATVLVETDLFKLAAAAAAKTATPWDDEAVKALEKLLGINQPIPVQP